MSSVRANKQRILLESKLRHLEEFIKGLEAYRGSYIQWDQRLRDAVRVDRAGFQSASDHLRHVYKLFSGVPPPTQLPHLSSILFEELNSLPLPIKVLTGKLASSSHFQRSVNLREPRNWQLSRPR